MAFMKYIGIMLINDIGLNNDVFLCIFGLFSIIFRKNHAILMSWWPRLDPSTYPLNRKKQATRFNRMEPIWKFSLQKVCFYMLYPTQTEEHIYLVYRGKKNQKNCIFDVFWAYSVAQYASPFPFYLGPQFAFDRDNAKFSLSTKMVMSMLVH